MITIQYYLFWITFTQKYKDQFNPPESLFELDVENAHTHDSVEEIEKFSKSTRTHTQIVPGRELSYPPGHSFCVLL